MADEHFIGLRKDDRSGQWRWLSKNSSSHTGLPWAKWEPNGEGNCATMYKDYGADYGKYNDLHCTTLAGPGYICEFAVDGCNQGGSLVHSIHALKQMFLTFLSQSRSLSWM